MYDRSHVHVHLKVELRSTYKFTRDTSYITPFYFRDENLPAYAR